jgi:hypothetical protein
MPERQRPFLTLRRQGFRGTGNQRLIQSELEGFEKEDRRCEAAWMIFFSVVAILLALLLYLVNEYQLGTF